MSWNTSTTPPMFPALSRIGAAAQSIAMGLSCRLRSTTLPSDWIVAPSRKARATGSGTSTPVASSSTEKTDGSAAPCASSARQPVRRSATGFMYSTLPDVSTVMTASAIDASVTCARSFCSSICASARLRSEMSASEPAIRCGVPRSPSTERPRVRNQRYVPSRMRRRSSISNGSPRARCRFSSASAWRRSPRCTRRRNEPAVSWSVPGA